MATLHELEEVAHERSFAARLIGHGAAARGQLALRQGDLAAGIHWAERSGLRVDDDVSYLHQPEYLTLARLRITMGCQTRRVPRSARPCGSWIGWWRALRPAGASTV